MIRRMSLPMRIWLALLALTGVSVLIAEQLAMRTVAIVAIFLIAALKAEFVIDHYMEAWRADRRWLVMYFAWVTAVTLLLVWGHTTAAQ
jgi:Prokaryotic Cytochrome C oxidase subunit IV